jgi:hypothetical protein
LGQGIPPKTTLGLILKQLGLAYCVHDGLLMISDPRGIYEELVEARAELGFSEGKKLTLWNKSFRDWNPMVGLGFSESATSGFSPGRLERARVALRTPRGRRQLADREGAAMTTEETRAELLKALAELGREHPNWRLGQTLSNLAMAAGRLDAGGVWDLEDGEALAAARRLIESTRKATTVRA